MRFNDVKDVQIFLHRLGWNPGVIDGKIGRNTLGALSRWVDSLDPESLIETTLEPEKGDLV